MNKHTSLSVKIVKDRFYPIRIQYGTYQSNKSPNILINIISSNTSTPLGPIDNYLFSINKSNIPYEPIQLCFSFIKTKESNELFRLTVSNYDINNNVEFNKLIRKSRSTPKAFFKDIIIFPSGLITFQNTGNLILNDSNGNTIDLTKIPNFMSCQGGTHFTMNPEIKLNNDYITNNLTSNQTKNIDINTGLPFTKYTYSGSTNNNPAVSDIYSANYTLGNEGIINTFSSIPEINVNNLNKVEQCSFTLTLTNDGDIQISNENKIIWTLFNGIVSQNKNQQMASPFPDVALQIHNAMTSNDTIVIDEWYDEYFNSYMTSNNLGNYTKNILKGGNKLSSDLISSNGKCKITIDPDSGAHIFRYATKIPHTHNYITIDEFNSGLVYLFGARMDMKVGKTFVANTIDNTIQYIPTTKDGVIQYSSSYTQYTGKYPNPPNVLDTGGIYSHWQNAPTSCDIICNQTDGCTHYYSYTTNDGSKHCTINNDGNSARFYPGKNNDNINSTNLYIRDKMIKSNCNINKFIPYNPKINSIIDGSIISPETDDVQQQIEQPNIPIQFVYATTKLVGVTATDDSIQFIDDNNNIIPIANAQLNTNYRLATYNNKNSISHFLQYNTPDWFGLWVNEYNNSTNPTGYPTSGDGLKINGRQYIIWPYSFSLTNGTSLNLYLYGLTNGNTTPYNYTTQYALIHITTTYTTPIPAPTPSKQTKILDITNAASVYDTYTINYSSNTSTITEGPCSDNTINSNINSYLNKNTEGFETQNTHGSWRETFTSVCDSTNPNVDACRRELINSVTSLQNTQAIVFDKNQQQINTNYNDLTNKISNYNILHPKVNGPYDAINDSSNLKYSYSDIPSSHLEDVRFEDSKQKLIMENNLYIIGTIVTATLLIAVISLSNQ